MTEAHTVEKYLSMMLAASTSTTRSKYRRLARRAAARETGNARKPRPIPISYVTYFDGAIQRKGGESYYGPAKRIVLAASVYANGSCRHFDMSSKPLA